MLSKLNIGLYGMSLLEDRIRQAREYAGISKAELARRCGISAAAAIQWEDGSTKSLKAESLIAICDATGVNPRWLALGKGKMAEKDSVHLRAVSNGEYVSQVKSEDVKLEELDPNEPVYITVPRMNIGVDAGSGVTMWGKDYKKPISFLKDFFIDNKLDVNAVCAMEVRGNDMLPTCKHGDVVILDLDKQMVQDGRIYVIRYGEHSLKLARVRHHYSGDLIITVDSKPDQEEVIKKEDLNYIEIVAEVIWRGGMIV